VLATAAAQAGYRIATVHSRTPAAARRLAGGVGARCVETALAAVRSAELTFLTVPDGAITKVAATVAASGVALRGRSVVHCSGAQGLEALAPLRQLAARVGAVHPLQALADAGSAGQLRGAFFAVDGDPSLRAVLQRFVADVGGTAFAAPAGDRSLYHAAAVLAGNAPLALLARATALLERAGVDPDVAGEALATLLEGAAGNARRLGARAALTGPVVRDDAATVRRHLEVLGSDPAALRLYRLMTEETLRTVGATGRERVASVLAGSGHKGAQPERRATAVPLSPTLGEVHA